MPSSFLPSLPLSPRVRQALIYGSFMLLLRLPVEKKALLWPLFRTLDGGQTRARVLGQHAHLHEFFKWAI